MSYYRLKQGVEGFDVVDGPLAGRQYRKGVVYDEIPPGDAAKFKEVRDTAPVKSAKADRQKAALKDLPLSEMGEVQL